MKKKELLHRNYWVGILSAIIICLLTMRYTADTELKEYVSFAATLASLILAILAILQAMYSNSAMTNTIGSLKDSSTSIQSNNAELTGIIKELRTKISNLPVEVSDSVNQALEKQGFTPSPETAAEQPKYTEKINTKYFENYVKLGSYNSLLLLHAIRLSIHKKRPFNLSEILPEEHKAVNLENMSGFLISHLAAGFVGFENLGGSLQYSNSLIEPQYIDAAIANVVTNDQPQELLNYFIVVKTHIDQLFN